ncbi:helix-turn-helix domain-containing protein [Enterococcus faecalis]
MYGETIKKIRKAKGLSQKNICKDIVTISYYSRIERNVSEPSIDVFLKILKVLGVSFDEFMYIHRGGEKSWWHTKWFELTEMYHSHDVDGLLKEKNLLTTEKESQEVSFFLSMINLFVSRLTFTETSQKHLQVLVNKLLDIETWTTLELRVFITLMDQIPLETNYILVNRILKKKPYGILTGYDSFFSKLMINIILLSVNEKNIASGFKYLGIFEENLETRDMYSRNMCLYLKGLLIYEAGEKKLGLDFISESFNIFERLGMEVFKKKYEEYFKQIVEK